MAVSRISCLALFLFAFLPAAAQRLSGVVTFEGMAVPGATVTVTTATRKINSVTDEAGAYEVQDSEDGPTNIEIEMQGVVTVMEDIFISQNATPAKWELRLLSIDKLLALSTMAPKKIQVLATSALAKKPDARPNVGGPTASDDTTALRRFYRK